MSQTPLFIFIAFLAASIFFVCVFRVLRLGVVLGYLVAGVVLAPYVQEYANNTEAILNFSEIGVVLFLFLVGLEMHPRTLWQIRFRVFVLGSLQMLLSTVVFALIAYFILKAWPISLFIGSICAFSSTAIVLQSLEEKNELLSSRGRLQLSILLFQDMAVIPLVVLVAFISPHAIPDVENVGTSILYQAGALLFLLFAGLYLINPILRLIGKANCKEIFPAVALFVVLSAAALMHMTGLSMALGSFMAGLMLSDSEYRHQIESDIVPFKSIILGLFFLSVGIDIQWTVFMDHAALLLGLTTLYLAVKIVILFFISKLDKQNNLHSMRLALEMSQGGEFAFVILQAMSHQSIVTGLIGEIITLVISLSMFGSAFLIYFIPMIERYWLKDSENKNEYDILPVDKVPVLIAGFGRFGQIIGRFLTAQGIPWTALDKSAQHIDFVRKYDSKVYFGDATRLHLLRAAGAEGAKSLAICVDTIEDSIKIITQAKQNFPHLKIFVRTRNRRHAYQLLAMGVEVQYIYKELFDSSLKMTEGILESLGFQKPQIHSQLEAFRNLDEKSMVEVFKDYENNKTLIRYGRQYERELEDLFTKLSPPKQPDENPLFSSTNVTEILAKIQSKSDPNDNES